MEPQAALVGADRAVHLDAETAVDLDLALVVDPRHAEHDHPLGLDQPLENLRLAIGGGGFDDRHDRFDHFMHGLKELGLAGILGRHLLHERIDRIRGFDHFVAFSCG